MMDKKMRPNKLARLAEVDDAPAIFLCFTNKTVIPDRVQAECDGRRWEPEPGERLEEFKKRVVKDQRSRGHRGSLFIMTELAARENGLPAAEEHAANKRNGET
jgi:hypothetical protein